MACIQGSRVSSLLASEASTLVPGILAGAILETGRNQALLRVAGSDRRALAFLCVSLACGEATLIGYEQLCLARFLVRDEVEEHFSRLERRVLPRGAWEQTMVARSLAFHGVPAEQIDDPIDAIVLLDAVDAVALGVVPDEGLMQDVFDVFARLPTHADLWGELLLDWLELVELNHGTWPTGRVAAAYFWRLLGEAEATLETLEGSDEPAPLWTETMGTAVAANAWLDLYERTGRAECLHAALERADRVMGLVPPDGPSEWVEDETRMLAVRLSRFVSDRA